MDKVSGFRFQVSGFRFNFVEGFAVQVLRFFRSSLKFFSQLSIVNCQLSILPVFLLLSVFSCRRYNTQQPVQDASEFERQRQEILLRVNRELVEEDAQEIKAYAERNGWQMKTTGSGLWYMIYKNGQGEKAATGKIATLEYTLSLLDSTVCYSSEQLGQKIFRLGQGGVETGLEEGVLLMRVGDKARMIMPPHLAHGLLGDGVCIPRRAIILYDVELVSIR